MSGKQKCKILKEIRQRIADENDIPYVTRECSFQGECTGTCPRCESELRYLEQQLERRRRLGKSVSVAALCVGMALASAGCSPSVKPGTESVQSDLTGEAAPPESDIEDLGGAVDVGEAAPPESDIEDLGGAVDVSEPSSGTESVELTGDVAWTESSSDPSGAESIAVQTAGEVPWPER